MRGIRQLRRVSAQNKIHVLLILEANEPGGIHREPCTSGMFHVAPSRAPHDIRVSSRVASFSLLETIPQVYPFIPYYSKAVICFIEKKTLVEFLQYPWGQTKCDDKSSMVGILERLLNKSI